MSIFQHIHKMKSRSIKRSNCDFAGICNKASLLVLIHWSIVLVPSPSLTFSFGKFSRKKLFPFSCMSISHESFACTCTCPGCGEWIWSWFFGVVEMNEAMWIVERLSHRFTLNVWKSIDYSVNATNFHIWNEMEWLQCTELLYVMSLSCLWTHELILSSVVSLRCSTFRFISVSLVLLIFAYFIVYHWPFTAFVRLLALATTDVWNECLHHNFKWKILEKIKHVQIVKNKVLYFPLRFQSRFLSPAFFFFVALCHSFVCYHTK